METGKAFEQEVKRLLEHELERGKLGIIPGCTKVFHRKGYWSKDRGNEIVTDVSVEVSREVGVEPYLIWIWECKDYQGQVPVGDVEEFHGKLEQIGLHKTKGTIACRNGFQKSARSYAEAMGIGLARILPSGSIIRLLEAVRKVTKEHIVFGLTEPETKRIESMFYGLSSSGRGVIDIGDLIAVEIGGKSQSPHLL